MPARFQRGVADTQNDQEVHPSHIDHHMPERGLKNPQQGGEHNLGQAAVT